MPANPWLERRVLNWAHQGGAKEGPSSTLHAMRAAVAAGADALELDVHMTADGHLVVCHDPTVDRTTAASGAIAALSLAEVQQLDNAFWWVPGSVIDHEADDAAYVHRGKAPADPDFAIPTLHDVLDAFPGVFMNLDIKQTAPLVPAYEAVLAEVLLARGRVDDVIVAAFADQSTATFAEAAPQISTSIGVAGTAEFLRAVRNGEQLPDTRHVALQVPASFGEVVIVDETFVTRAHEHGLAVHVWTIDEPDEMARLLDLDVDGIMTDRPSLLEHQLRERGLQYLG
ncbi:MAG: Glycerophosphoryl diester phosphodiesterase [uncultured Acidimicrobiales bacterium]|uniref:Glycerophosphoryl diester phosphodiesterase n=1 Tax=uncultured Acidimicrobiales bacterium TaxID=310071 RepID=A0A6J4HBQ9_9ACTN|nr:MAG: Glycerophosphoryl diester phosphodiesterase [uncultured Acidimicrobiales bacterium]